MLPDGEELFKRTAAEYIDELRAGNYEYDA
jgi:hypothetical protein